MLRSSDPRSKPTSLEEWFKGKPPEIRDNFVHFVEQYKAIGKVAVRSATNMIVISTARKGIAYVVPRKSFIDIVFPFRQQYLDTLCFHKVVQNSMGRKEYNHHLRMLTKGDINAEVKGYMMQAYREGV